MRSEKDRGKGRRGYGIIRKRKKSIKRKWEK
jgi:hypothetical protein